jgi:mannose-1-phosphate guanylyltransferase
LLELAGERDAQVLAVAPRPQGEGTLGLAADGSVVRLRGRVFGDEARGGDYIGVMALGPSVVAGLPERGCLFGDVALPHLAAGRKVWTVPSLTPWSDLGDLRAYVAANFDWLDRQATASPARSWLGRGVEIAPGVRVERSVLGVGAKLLGEGTVTEVIAWPGAVFSAPLSRAVVLGSGRVVPFDGAAEK